MPLSLKFSPYNLEKNDLIAAIQFDKIIIVEVPTELNDYQVKTELPKVRNFD